MLKRIAAAVLAAGMLLAPTAASAAEPPAATTEEKVVAYVEPAIVRLQSTYVAQVWDPIYKTYFADGKGPIQFELSTGCTGFAVTPDGYIATAGHCVTGILYPQDVALKNAFIAQAAEWASQNNWYGPNFSAEGIYKFGVKEFYVDGVTDLGKVLKNKLPTTHVEVYLDTLEDSFPARIITKTGFINGGDSALLKIEAEDLPTVDISNVDMETGQSVISIGFPASVDAVTDFPAPSYRSGTIGSVQTQGDGLLPVYEITAQVNPGMSGGPTVNAAGDVIGINSFYSPDGGEADATSFVQPTDVLLELLGSTGIEARFSPIHADYVAGLDAYFAGDKGLALEKFEEVEAENDDYLKVGDFLADAEALPDDFPLVPTIVGGVVLVGLATGLVFFASKRKSKDVA